MQHHIEDSETIRNLINGLNNVIAREDDQDARRSAKVAREIAVQAQNLWESREIVLAVTEGISEELIRFQIDRLCDISRKLTGFKLSFRD